jgi:hypothetical protein
MKNIALALALAIPASGMAAEPNIRPGVYSNMRFMVEDVIGMEIFVLYTRDGYYALVQCSAAEPNVPELVPLKVQAESISFTLSGPYSSDCGGATFAGTISRGVLSGSFSGSKDMIRLQRRASHWQQ